MNVSYNGVELEVLSVEEFVRQQVWTEDQTTHLWDHVSLRCKAWVNPNATALSHFLGTENQRQGGYAERVIEESDQRAAAYAESGFGTPDPSDTPVLTVLDMVSRLRDPRKKLVVWLHDKLDGSAENSAEIILESPVGDHVCDHDNGPRCTVFGIEPWHGNASLVVDVQIETAVDACNAKGPILSNRWDLEVVYDEANYAAAYVIQGEMIFAIDRLLNEGLSADSFRAFMVPPCPAGYQREPPQFRLSPNGNAVQYRIIDRQTPMSFPGAVIQDGPDMGKPSGAARVEVHESRAFSTPHWASAAYDGLGALGNAIQVMKGGI